MLDILFSLEALTTVIAFIATSWGLVQKFKERKARKEALSIQRAGQNERRILINEGRQQRQALVDELQEIRERHENDLAITQEQFENISNQQREDLALLRGEVGKLMDMIMSGEEITVEPKGGIVSIRGVTGEVTMLTNTLNKVVEATTSCRYEKSGGMFNKGLKRVVIEPDPNEIQPSEPWTRE